MTPEEVFLRLVHGVAGGFRVPCVFVLRVRDGEIVESRDYIDHVAMARARGRLGELIAVLREPAAAAGAS